MNTQYTSLDDLKAQWQELTVALEVEKEKNRRLVEQIRNSNARSANQLLARGYRRISVLGFLMPVVGLGMLTVAPVWLIVVYGLIGIGSGVTSLWLANYISRIDYLGLPVEKALEHALQVVHYQKIIAVVSWCVNAILIGTLLWFFYHLDIGAFVGCLIGLGIGLPIGIAKEIQYFRRARRLVDVF